MGQVMNSAKLAAWSWMAHLVDALEPRLKDNGPLRRARRLPEGAPVDDDAEIGHALFFEGWPLLLERRDDQLERLPIRVRMLLGPPKVGQRDHRQRAILAPGGLGDGQI